MKRLGILLIGLFAVSALSAQNREVMNCWSALKEGFLDDAHKSINKAAEHPKTKDDYKTWWYYGRTYQELSTAEKKKYKDLCEENCADQAFDAYIKSLRLNFQDPEMKKLDLEKQTDIMKFFKALQDSDTKLEDQKALVDIITVRLPALANGFVNQGIDAFREQSYETALEKFEKSLTVSSIAMKMDTQVLYFTSLAAINSGDWERTVQYNEMLKQINYGNKLEEKVNIYQSLAMGYINTGDTTKFVNTLEVGIEKFPEASYPLVIDLFNYYVDIKENEKALDYISMAIENNPNNAQFFVIRGTLYEETNQQKKAIKEYESAVELQPENFDANYSLGAYYYNYAADTLSWANNNIPPTEPQKYDEVKKAADGLFEKALPYLENAKALKPNDVTVLSTLKTIYYRMGNLEKHDEIKAELDALTE